jgi:hypothetical protein
VFVWANEETKLNSVALLFCSTVYDERTGLQFTVQLLLSLARAVTLGSQSSRTHGHTSMSHLRLPHPGGAGTRIQFPPPPEKGGPVILPGTGFPFGRLLRDAGLRRKYSNPPQHGKGLCKMNMYSLQRAPNPRQYGWYKRTLSSSLQSASMCVCVCVCACVYH